MTPDQQVEVNVHEDPVVEVELIEPTLPSETYIALDKPNVDDRGHAGDCCKGMNECKGRGNCKTEWNDCAGKNECKGQGGCKPADCDSSNSYPRPKPYYGGNCCKGMNACKGLGNCKTSYNNCAGMNSCKGQGGCKPANCP